jgi:hypothetical protein
MSSSRVGPGKGSYDLGRIGFFSGSSVYLSCLCFVLNILILVVANLDIF